MKFNYKLAMMALAVASLASSCSDDNKWEPGPAADPDNMTVYIEQPSTYSYIFEEEDSPIVKINVSRAFYDEAASVPVLFSGLPENVAVPAAVEFEAGQKTVTFELDLTSLPIKKTYTITMSIDPAYTTPYGAGMTDLTFTALKAGQWLKIAERAQMEFGSNLYPTQYLELWVLDGTQKFKIKNFLNSGLDFEFTSSNPDGTGVIVPLKNGLYCIDYDSSYEYGDYDFYLYNTELDEWPASFSPDGSSPKWEWVSFYNGGGYSGFYFKPDLTQWSSVYFVAEFENDDASYGYAYITVWFKPAFNPFLTEDESEDTTE